MGQMDKRIIYKLPLWVQPVERKLVPPLRNALLDLDLNPPTNLQSLRSLVASSYPQQSVKNSCWKWTLMSDSDTETEFISRVTFTGQIVIFREVELKNDLREVELKNELRQARVDLDNALQGAATLRAAEDTRNRCPYCLNFCSNLSFSAVVIPAARTVLSD
ncbi:hypothetical protein LENED_011986 [Lentinula edodes]|uniref:Uncharacterized protein n=1 Tax=Lentinula edodes TaxID=5353 RepID=A0A1Q3ERI1_LENED|nr:hypothetical protein LENED_011986 [Lentinula edodes]